MSVGGLPLTVGTFPELTAPDRKYPISPIDAPIVSRVLEAGATIIGISTCENYSCTSLSYTSASGPVHNPWLFGHTVGGSSSGNSVMLSLGLVRKAGVSGLDHAGDSIELALGGDQGGSIRLPASFTGIYGLKPTFGLVPCKLPTSMSSVIVIAVFPFLFTERFIILLREIAWFAAHKFRVHRADQED